MRLNHLVFTCLLGLAAPSLAKVAHIITSDRAVAQEAASHLDNVSPLLARLVLAQRLGLEEFHSIDSLDADAIDVLDKFSGGESSFFSKEDEPPRLKVFLVLEDVELSQLPDLPPSQDGASFANRLKFAVEDVPDTESTRALVQSFASQKRYQVTPLSAHSQSQRKYWRGEFIHGEQTLYFDTPGLIAVASQAKSHTNDVVKKLDEYYAWAERHEVDLTCMLTESDTSNSLLSKRSEATWGNFPRQDFSSDTAVTLDTSSSATQFESIRQDDDDDSSGEAAAPSGVLPPYFPTLQTCQETTLNCSGHGSCVLQAQYRDGDETVTRYACACDTSVVEVEGGGTQTTRWAGPACQKKDVAVPFWLITGFTVTMVAIISGGVGLLYSMGQEELPSVIGAGVAGPKAR